MKRFINLLRQDMVVAQRNYFHYVVITLAVLMSAVILFLIPNTVKLTPNELFLDLTHEKRLEDFARDQGTEEGRIFQSKEGLLEAVDKNSNSLGIILEGDMENAKVTVIHQGTESVEIINVLDATIQGALDEIRGITRKANYQVQYLRPKTDPIPFNKMMVPLMVVTEAVMLGFLLIAVMVFQEKEEGSVRAYRITPSGTMVYILSKAVINVGLAVLYTSILIFLTMGFQVNILAVLMIVVLASFLMTLVGLSISVFFDNLQQFIFIGVLVIGIISMPIASYLTPAISMPFMEWLPSYPVLFGLREVLFPTGKAGMITAVSITLGIEIILFIVISYHAVRNKLMGEGQS